MSQALIDAESSPMIFDRELPMAKDRSSRLTSAQIAAAAFGLAESDGLPVVSVKRVAARLGIPAPRLEQYLQTRDDLLDLMFESALAEIDLSAVSAIDTADWSLRLRRLAEATYATATVHPWLVELIGSRSPMGPAGLTFIETALRTLTDAGFDLPGAALHMDTILALVAGSVRSRAQSTQLSSDRDHGPHAAEQRAERAQHLMDTVSDGNYPRLAQLFATGSATAPGESFAHGLDLLLAGLASASPHVAS